VALSDDVCIQAEGALERADVPELGLMTITCAHLDVGGRARG
jgi:hypothetical protein